MSALRDVIEIGGFTGSSRTVAGTGAAAGAAAGATGAWFGRAVPEGGHPAPTLLLKLSARFAEPAALDGSAVPWVLGGASRTDGAPLGSAAHAHRPSSAARCFALGLRAGVGVFRHAAALHRNRPAREAAAARRPGWWCWWCWWLDACRSLVKHNCTVYATFTTIYDLCME